MSQQSIRLTSKLEEINEQWSPKVISQLNDYHVKLAKIQGAFVWHSHPETDELFYVVEGSMAIELRDGRVELSAGEMYVVPKGVEHKPVAEAECSLLLIEPKGTVNTGDAGGDMTSPNDVWI